MNDNRRVKTVLAGLAVCVLVVAVIVWVRQSLVDNIPSNEETIVETTVSERIPSQMVITTTRMTTALKETTYAITTTMPPVGTDSAYIIPESNSRYLLQADVENMTITDLIYAISEIYARHGYIFGDTEFAEYFATKSWYMPSVPAEAFDDTIFNEYEQQNRVFLRECAFREGNRVRNP